MIKKTIGRSIGMVCHSKKENFLPDLGKSLTAKERVLEREF